MNDRTINAIVKEFAPLIAGRRMAKIIQLSRLSVALDFIGVKSGYLFIGLDAQLSPRLYMIERRARDVEKQAIAPTPFVQVVQRRLGGATLRSVVKDGGDRIVRFTFASESAAGEKSQFTLVAQLTGRAANLLFLDHANRIIDSLRSGGTTPDEIGATYSPPLARIAPNRGEEIIERGEHSTLSEAADDYYQQEEDERSWKTRLAAAQSHLKRSLSQLEKRRRNLEQDLSSHGDPHEHKKTGDLLLANLSTATREGSTVTLIDYFDEDAPKIDVEVAEESSLQQEAERRFGRYTKAKRAGAEIERRLSLLNDEIKAIRVKERDLAMIVESHDYAALDVFLGGPARNPQTSRQKNSKTIPGTRRYRSSDKFEILVGRAAHDNDHLTFKVARPNDMWMHAADYPGSHVVVLNPARKEIPQRTVIEAAQLAAKFSHARHDAKVDVHYTPRKFLSKPKGSAPGLVRMSTFRTITVEPKEAGERILA